MIACSYSYKWNSKQQTDNKKEVKKTNSHALLPYSHRIKIGYCYLNVLVVDQKSTEYTVPLLFNFHRIKCALKLIYWL